MVPLDRSAGFDEARSFARNVADLLTRRHPDELTTEHRKKKRGDRVFVDCLRIAFGQTGAAPYAVRAREGAPVATPLEWDELGRQGQGPRKYTVENLFRRLSQRDDPWKGIARRAPSLSDPRDRLREMSEGEP